MVPFFRGWRSCAPSDLPLTKLVVGKRSGEILLNSTWKVRTERTQPLVVWPLVLIVSPLADEERELLEWLASHGLTRFAARITKVSYDLDDRRAYRRGHRERRVPDSCEGADLEKRDSVPPRGQGIIGSSPIGCLSRPHDSPTLIDTPRKRAAWGGSTPVSAYPARTSAHSYASPAFGGMFCGRRERRHDHGASHAPPCPRLVCSANLHPPVDPTRPCRTCCAFRSGCPCRSWRLVPFVAGVHPLLTPS